MIDALTSFKRGVLRSCLVGEESYLPGVLVEEYRIEVVNKTPYAWEQLFVNRGALLLIGHNEKSFAI